MPSEPVLRIEDEARVRTLTLSRPEAKNAFSDELYDSVRLALEEASGSPEIAVCLITGAGDVFSAGQDLKALEALRTGGGAGGGTGGGWAFPAFAKGLAAFDKPLVAAVNGAAVGVGTTLLFHCDVVLASTAARFRVPFVNLGLAPEAGSSFLMPARMGPQTAAYYLLTGDWIDAETAVASGLARRLCEPDQLLKDATELARRIAAAPVDALVTTKRLLLASRSEALGAAIDRENVELRAIIARMMGPASPE